MQLSIHVPLYISLIKEKNIFHSITYHARIIS
jgi:hypothetical protein